MIEADLEALSTQVDALTALTSSDQKALPEPIEPEAESNPQQFEMEYTILSELWDALLTLQHTTLDLQMATDQSESYAPQRGRNTEQLRQFAESYNALSQLVHRKRPFYPRAIFNALVRIMAPTEMGVTPLSSDEGDQEQGYWENAINRADEIVEGIDQVCELIRKRMVG